MRPSELSQDTTPMIEVLQHALAWALRNSKIDAVVLLQPTSPMRKAAHIKSAIEKYIEHEAECVVSVVKVPHQFTPESIYMDKKGLVTPYLQSCEGYITRRQDKPVYFARNGPAILISSANLIKAGNLYGKRVVPYEMSYEDSLDIDAVSDLEYFKFHAAHDGS
jgi:CMP-N-acetylneuraminic acid synthetase